MAPKPHGKDTIIPEAPKFKSIPLGALDELERYMAKLHMMPLIHRRLNKDEIIESMLSHYDISRQNSLAAWEELEREKPFILREYYLDLARAELKRPAQTRLLFPLTPDLHRGGGAAQTRLLFPQTPDVYRGGRSNSIAVVEDDLKI